MFRCVKSNVNDDVINISLDHKQGGIDYFGKGKWEDFIFKKLPVIPKEILDWAHANKFNKPLLKVVNKEIVSKTIAELELELKK